jgi:hypothetical protein
MLDDKSRSGWMCIAKIRPEVYRIRLEVYRVRLTWYYLIENFLN